MPKPDPSLLRPERYPFATEVDVRFGDIDVNKHVNNVSLAGFVEEGRVRFHRESGFHGAVRGLGAMVVSVATEFVGQAYYPGTLTIHAGAVSLGRSSYELDLLIEQDGRAVAFARSVMVTVIDSKPCPIPDAFRASSQAWMVRW